jgi:hypothetical protein
MSLNGKTLLTPFLKLSGRETMCLIENTAEFFL